MTRASTARFFGKFNLRICMKSKGSEGVVFKLMRTKMAAQMMN